MKRDAADGESIHEFRGQPNPYENPPPPNEQALV